jgi:PAS domain S-box-containing protein
MRISLFIKLYLPILIIIAFGSYFIYLIASADIQKDKIEREKSITASFILASAQEYLSPDVFISSDRQNNKLIFENFYKKINYGEIVNMKFWSSQGEILFSSSDKDIEGSFPANEEFDEAKKNKIIAEIKTNTELTDKYSDSNKNIYFDNLMELYVPITYEGSESVIGVIELYIDLEKVNNEISSIKDKLAATILAELLILAISIALLLKIFIISPINNIVSTIGNLLHKSNNLKLNIKNGDELGFIAKNINEMLSEINNRNKKLAEGNEKIKSIISSMGEGLIVVDNYYKIIMINKVTENLLKISPKKSLGKNIRDVLIMLKDEKELSANEWPLEKVFKDKKPNRININDNIYLKSDSGRMFPAQMSIDPLFKEKFNGAVIVFRDATELKNLEEEREFAKYNTESILRSVYVERDNVQAGKNKLEATLNSIGDAVLAVWEDKRIVILNPIAEKICGYSFKKVENKNYKDFLKFIKEDTKEELDIISMAFNSNNRIIRNDLALLNKNKNLISIDISAAPIKDQNNKKIGIIIVFRDVMEKREIERMRSDFISTVSHQLRTPLSAMKWFIEILLNGDVGKLKNEQVDVINEVRASNQNMIDFVNQMLSVSRIENEDLVINPETINLENSINEFINEILPITKEKKQELAFSGIKDKSLEIKIDKNLLRNIIHNLLINASRYTPDNGKISLSVKKHNKDDLLFIVKDNGIGIPKKDYGKLFKKFSRAGNAIKYEASGSGLGLYIIKSILDLVGGKIWFESEENKGTAFFFTLPIDSIFCAVKKKQS